MLYDVPPGPFGGSEGYAFSPDGAELAFTAKDQGREDAWSTDINVYTVSVAGGAPRAITGSNSGADQNPVYSPDGRTIIYASLERPGFEADKGRLMAYDRATGTSREILPRWDRSADSYAFSPSGDAIYITSVDRGRDKLFRISRSGAGWSSIPQLLSSGGNNTALSVSRDGKTLAWLQDATERPAEVFVATVGAAGLTDVGAHARERSIVRAQAPPRRDFCSSARTGDSVHGFVLKPRSPARENIPAVSHYADRQVLLVRARRWNYELFASQGIGWSRSTRADNGIRQKFVSDHKLGRVGHTI